MDYSAKLRERKTNERKRQEVLRWLSSLTVTVVVAVAVYVVPSPPTAEFLRLETYGNTIFYETQVRDADSAIVDGTLKIRLEAPLYEEEQPLELGMDSGAFPTLLPGRDYTISILSDQGFGQTRLAQETLSTLPEPGGRIIGRVLLENPNPIPHYQELLYRVDTLVVDPEFRYSGLRLRYAVVYSYEQPSGPPPLADFLPATPDLEQKGSYMLGPIPDYNVRVYLVLEATDAEGATVELDSTDFATPLHLQSSLYVDSAASRSLDVAFYGDYSTVKDIEYSLVVRQAGRVKQTLPLLPDFTEYPEESQTIVRIVGLNPSTSYHLEVQASYTDPETGVDQTTVLQIVKAMTLGDFEAEVTFVANGAFCTITVDAYDPDGQLETIHYYVVMTSPEGWEQYYGSGLIAWTDSGNGNRVGTAEVAVPADASYAIYVTGTLVMTTEIIYSSQPLGEFTFTVQP